MCFLLVILFVILGLTGLIGGPVGALMLHIEADRERRKIASFSQKLAASAQQLEEQKLRRKAQTQYQAEAKEQVSYKSWLNNWFE